MNMVPAACGNALLNAPIFLVKQDTRSSAETENVARGVRNSRTGQKRNSCVFGEIGRATEAVHGEL